LALIPCSSLLIARIKASNFCSFIRFFRASVLSWVQHSSLPFLGDMPFFRAFSFFAIIKLKSHSLAILSLNW